jgi:hypothetical protein
MIRGQSARSHCIAVRTGEAVKRAFHGEIEAHFDEDGYFTRVNWTPAA